MNPIDKMIGLKALKDAVNEEYKKAELDARDYFDDMEKQGIKSVGSPLFGAAGGEYHRGRTRAKTVVEYNLVDWDGFSNWLYANVDAMHRYCFAKAEAFAEDLVEKHGEIPDGVERVERQEPPSETAPKLYKYDRDGVLACIAQGGNLFEKANELLLGDAE